MPPPPGSRFGAEQRSFAVDTMLLQQALAILAQFEDEAAQLLQLFRRIQG
ncbi:hypothetical protein GALL_257720 [mine drainage metagenome]|uniref:Uncharacterized protein n=1 Tax=mine drainage metagenome TaxID=410659 RepID=A0A1J5R8B3_9ZZZZ